MSLSVSVVPTTRAISPRDQCLPGVGSAEDETGAPWPPLPSVSILVITTDRIYVTVGTALPPKEGVRIAPQLTAATTA